MSVLLPLPSWDASAAAAPEPVTPPPDGLLPDTSPPDWDSWAGYTTDLDERVRPVPLM